VEDLLESGRLLDGILTLVLLELGALALWRRQTGAGIPLASLLPNLAAGACLLLALRAAATGAAWPWVVLWLTLALPCHALDLRARWARPTAKNLA
jgi:hypothetical protein